MSPSPTEGAPKNIDELKELLKDDTKVKVAIVDVDGVLRGKIMSKAKFLSAASSTGFGFCSVVFGWDILDTNYFKPLLVGNEENGFGDLTANIDLETYRRLPWEKNVPFFLCRLSWPETGKPLEVDPRSLLAAQTSRAAEMGYTCMSGAEYEYFQFKETPHSLAGKRGIGMEPLTPGMHGYSMLRPTYNIDYFHELYDAAVAFGIDVEGHHTETGPGVYETALGYTDAGRMADNACLFKLVAKSVGSTYGIMPTFMAKPWGDLPGCSGHTHVSLRDKNGRNIFAATDEEIKAGGRTDAAFSDTRFLSREAEWFLGGLLEGLPDVIPMMCPTINSYKRLLGGEVDPRVAHKHIADAAKEFWAPDTSSYGYDSRHASIRIISPPGCPSGGTRFEVRVPGADMNPYFVMAAIFGLGLNGIADKTPLPYGPRGAPGVTRETMVKLPTTLEKATETFMRTGSVARKVFGDFFVDHFGGTREHELEVHRRAVTNWEVERYFELV